MTTGTPSLSVDGAAGAGATAGCPAVLPRPAADEAGTCPPVGGIKTPAMPVLDGTANGFGNGDGTAAWEPGELASEEMGFGGDGSGTADVGTGGRLGAWNRPGAARPDVYGDALDGWRGPAAG